MPRLNQELKNPSADAKEGELTLLATPRGEADEPLEPRSLLPLPWLEPGDGGDGPPSKERRLDQRTM